MNPKDSMWENREEKRPAAKRRGEKIAAVAVALALCAGATATVCSPIFREHFAAAAAKMFSLSKPAAYASAVTTDALNLRDGKGTGSRIVVTLPRGTAVQLLERSDSGEEWVRVRTADGRAGWCSALYLDYGGSSSAAPPSSLPEQSGASSAAREAKPSMAVLQPQVALEQAAAPLSVSVSIAEQRVTVYDAEKRVVKQFVCSTGEQGSETPTGTFQIAERGESFYSEKVGEGGYYWTQFQGNYLFHSVPFDKDKKIEAAEAAKLGTPASHGCVRLSVDDAKWIYDHIPRGTEVTIR